MQFQRRSWALQRVGWALMAVAIVCGLLGVFGAGLLSSASVENPESVRIEYERFIRYQVPTSLKIKLRTATGTDRTYLSIGRDYLDAMKIEKIVPEPAAEKRRTARSSTFST